PKSADSFQVDSDWYAPERPSACSAVPPTPVTFGSLAGVLAALKLTSLLLQSGRPAPWSPEDANSVMPLPTAAPTIACCGFTSAGSMHCSASRKLCEIVSPRLLSTAYWVASRMSASSFDFAITSAIAAPGAIACAHSTSSVVSPDHPSALSGVVGSIPNGV